MTIATTEKNILVKDLEGTWYSIPPSMKSDFEEMKEVIIDAPSLSSEWFDAVSNFNETFGQFVKEE